MFSYDKENMNLDAHPLTQDEIDAYIDRLGYFDETGQWISCSRITYQTATAIGVASSENSTMVNFSPWECRFSDLQYRLAVHNALVVRYLSFLDKCTQQEINRTFILLYRRLLLSDILDGGDLLFKRMTTTDLVRRLFNQILVEYAYNRHLHPISEEKNYLCRIEMIYYLKRRLCSLTLN